MMHFKTALQGGEDFVVTCELVPGRGYTGAGVDNILRFAEQAKDSPQIYALSLTDNAGGNPALSADVLGTEIIGMGVDLIVHFSCKDFSRNELESRAYALKRSGVTNLLVVTGDYPVSGFLGLSKPVFDVDSVMALHYFRKMNEGLRITVGRKEVTLEPTDFFLGAVASPFKATEGSAMMQYRKLEKKIRAGANYVITQLGYDSRKYAELIRYVRRTLGLGIPVMGSVYVLSAGAARYMAGGEVPGCYVDERLVRAISQEAKADDKGRAARLERAARQVAILKGLGYNGTHIEGLNLKFADVQAILERSREIGANWRDHLEQFDYSPKNGFFMFSGGGRFQTVRGWYQAAARSPGNGGTAGSAVGVAGAGGEEELSYLKTPRRRVPSLTFWAMRLMHNLFFLEETAGYRFMRRLSRFAEKRRFWYRLFSAGEAAVKKALFDCRRCDDCALFETFYLCPESRCPKGQRIGPCGGSRVDGSCEVFPGRPCIWELVYRRAKNRRELPALSYIIPPRDWKLYETSSWVNYFCKHDHSGVRLDIPETLAERRPVHR